MISLNNLLYPWIDNIILNNKYINGISTNSKDIKHNFVFISVKGSKNDGRKFIEESINNGSLCIIIESDYIKNHGIINNINNILFIYFFNLKKYISYICGNYYNNPSKNISVIGITGTNGKTTTCYLISNWLNLIGEKSAIISTIGNGIINKLYKTNNTTDSALDMQREIYKFKSIGINIIISEITSHSLSQYRVKSIYFRSAIFTNISHDHLDFHKSLTNYKNSKLSFFTDHNIFSSNINLDDKFSKKIIKKINGFNSISFNYNNKLYGKNWIKVIKIINNIKQTYVIFNSNFGIFSLKVNFICNFNISNLLLSMITLLDMGYSIKDLIKTSEKLRLPIGRVEFYYKNNKIIIIDYAHTSNSIENLFISIKNIYLNKKIYTLFGCGGNRDYKKRSIIGKIIEKYSYKFIITNDNPRDEDPIKIINDITKNIINKNNLVIILDRKEAIDYIIKKSNYNDIIIIFGKGHENYQIFKNNNIIYHSDINIIKSI